MTHAVHGNPAKKVGAEGLQASLCLELDLIGAAKMVKTGGVGSGYDLITYSTCQ